MERNLLRKIIKENVDAENDLEIVAILKEKPKCVAGVNDKVQDEDDGGELFY